jgi:hypothetical protein
MTSIDLGCFGFAGKNSNEQKQAKRFIRAPLFSTFY